MTDSISPAALQLGQTKGGSPGRFSSSLPPLLLVNGSGQPVRACQHFLDDKPIRCARAD